MRKAFIFVLLTFYMMAGFKFKYFVGFNGGISLLEPSLTRNWSFTVYQESCSVEDKFIFSAYTYDYDFYAGYCPGKSCFGLMIFYRFGKFDAKHTMMVPHPLYFDQYREGEWNKEEYELSQGNLALFYRYLLWRKKRVETAVFVTGGYTRLNLQLPTKFQFEETYPFESVVVSGYKADKKGYNGAVLGGGLDLGFYLSPLVQFSIHLFYTYPIVKIDAPGHGKVYINLGKVSLTGGFNLRF